MDLTTPVDSLPRAPGEANSIRTSKVLTEEIYAAWQQAIADADITLIQAVTRLLRPPHGLTSEPGPDRGEWVADLANRILDGQRRNAEHGGITSSGDGLEVSTHVPAPHYEAVTEAAAKLGVTIRQAMRFLLVAHSDDFGAVLRSPAQAPPES